MVCRENIDEYVLLAIYSSILVALVCIVVGQFDTSGFDPLYLILVLVFLLPEIGYIVDKLNKSGKKCTKI